MERKIPSLPSRWAATPSPDDSPDTPLTPVMNGLPQKEPETAETPGSAKANGAIDGALTNCLLSSQKATSSRSNSPNPKSVIKWAKKRNIVIQIPHDTPFGLPSEEGGRPMPLTPREVEQRLQTWRDRGYNTDVFGGQGPNRELYPEERKGKVEPSECFVSIPDKRDWEAYVTALREEKLRALGVLDTPAPSVGPREQTPLSHLASPALDAALAHHISPPPQTVSAMSNPHGPFNPFSPVSVAANLTPAPVNMPSPANAPPNHHLAFHLPRQSISVSGTLINPADWDQYGMFTPPGGQRPTPPMAGSGVWSPPHMRNGSPGMPMNMSMHSHSASQFNAGFHGEPPQEFTPHHSFVGNDRYHQQQVRRGSPLARVNHSIYQVPEEIRTHEAPAIDAPVPKHRHQLSVTLQKEYDNVDSYHPEGVRKLVGQEETLDEEGFTTNPVSPAPIPFPEQPDMPEVERDIHTGPELASNPDDDVQDEEEEKLKNRQEAEERQKNMDFNQGHYASGSVGQVSVHEVTLPQEFMPESRYAATSHSREQSLSQRRLDYDSVDPIQHSAMSMLMAGDGLAGPSRGRPGLDELLSEDGRTNISDIVTNPSEPPSPKRKFSTTASHTRHISNNSNAWLSDTTKTAAPSAASSASKPKFNVNAKEFKFDPTASFNFQPKAGSFAPSSQSTQQEQTPASQSTGFDGYSAPGFSASAATFRPNLVTTGTLGAYFEKGAAVFSPGAEEFVPSHGKPTRPHVSSIFGGAVNQPPTKKAIPIVRPPSRLQDHDEASGEKSDSRREAPDQGSRKKPKRSPTTAAVDDSDVPQFESLAPASDDLPTKETEAVPAETDDVAGESTETERPAEHVEPHLVQGVVEEPVKETIETTEIFKEPFDSEPPQNDVETDEFAATNDEILLEETAVAIGVETPPSEPEAIIAETTPEPKTFELHPEAPPFELRPAAQEFNFEFHRSPSPPKQPSLKVFGGMADSRYAHTPSPPPSHPAPPPPPVANGSPFLPPRDSIDVAAEPEKRTEYGRVERPVPTDAELDEVLRYINQSEPIYTERASKETMDKDSSLEDRAVSPWKRNANQRMGIPDFGDEPTPHRKLQALRSAGPSPSPGRVQNQFIRHRTPSFSPDEESELPVHAIGGTFDHQPEEIGIAKDVDSDWDDMISENGQKLRPQSRLFFDSHVEELVGGLLQRRLDPVLRSLVDINDKLNAPPVLDGKPFMRMVHSDADDEDEDDIPPPPKSPRDKKLDRIKSAVAEVLLSQNRNADVQERLDGLENAIRQNNLDDQFADLKAFIEGALPGDTRSAELIALRATLEELSYKVAHNSELSELRSVIADSLKAAAQAQDVATIIDSLTTIQSSVAEKDDVASLHDGLEKLAFQTVQRGEITDIKTAIVDAVSKTARKEDLVPIHNVFAEAFAKTAKTEELVELGRVLETASVAHGVNVKSTQQEVLNLVRETADFKSALNDLYRMTKDNSDNMDFHQESHLEYMKEGQALVTQRLGEIYSAVVESTNVAQSRGAKSDMRRNLFEKEHKEDAARLKKAVAELGSSIEENIKALGQAQPDDKDFRAVADNVSSIHEKVYELGSVADKVSSIHDDVSELRTVAHKMSSIHDKVDQFRTVLEETNNAPFRLEDIEAVIEKAVNGTSGVEEFKQVIEEDRVKKTEEFRSVISQVAQAQPTLADFRTLMEDVIAKQQLFVPLNFDSKADAEEIENLKKSVESLRREAAAQQKRADEEAQSKRGWEERAIELETKLKLAQEDTEMQRQEAEEKDKRLKAADEKRHQAFTSATMRSALLEGAHSSLQKSVGELSAQKAALEGSLQEAKESEAKHRARSMQLENENRDLRRSIETLRSEMEESIRVREGFRTKFDRVQENMRRVSVEIAQEQAQWRKTQDEQAAHMQVLEAQLAAEATKSQGLEGEVRRLEMAEKEAIRLRTELETTQRAASKTEELIAQLRHDAIESQNRTAQLAHEVESTRQAARDEVARITQSFQNDLTAANAELASTKDALEKQAQQTRYEIDQVAHGSAAEREKFKIAITEAEESKKAALDEQKAQFERQVKDIRVEQERLYKIATEDAQREQYFAKERMNIAQTESKHLRQHIESLQAQIKSLNENFKIANQAAQAAAQAATSVKEMSAPHLSDERALRESVDVLQNQLQQREARIERLESEVAGLDKNKIKQTEAELTMYRELLDMRIDDLEEIIHSCNLQRIDREGLRDAATRLKANLQMQHHEKERSMGIAVPENKGPAANLASRLPGVATAAWANWRGKGRNSGDTTPTGPPQATPSRPSSAASGFLNGILTPPNTALALAQARSRFGRGPTTDAPTSVPQPVSRNKVPPAAAPRRRTPSSASSQLFRKTSYDADADSSVLSGEFYDDESDQTETGQDHGDMEPFGPSPYSQLH